MKIILVSKRNGEARTFRVGAWAGAMLSVCLMCVVGVPAGAYYAYLKAVSSDVSDVVTADIAKEWSNTLDHQHLQIEESRQQAQQHLAVLSLRVAELQARLVRLDALGERLTTMAKLDAGEFDFSQPPAIGGPETELSGDSFTAPGILSVIDDVAKQIENRQAQLDTLDALLVNRKLESERFIAGRPIKQGWLSSRFGRRTDPFSGKIAWHNGVDFAGKEGSDIVAVAAGVVTWSGHRGGYGLMIEINHGNGFKTRYAHGKENLVKVGDVVKKGQVIGLIGSSGRSTGPHVHFEVYKNGRAVDPSSYIHRASR